MKVYQALLPLAAAMMIAGCGSRSTAQNVVGQAENALNEVRGDASVAAPNELKAADTTLAHMKQNFDQREYKVVIADVPQFNNQMNAVKTAIGSSPGSKTRTHRELCGAPLSCLLLIFLPGESISATTEKKGSPKAPRLSVAG